MKTNKRKEELQSRREFFKKAAKSALPILGAIVLANVPTALKATTKKPMGCDYGCLHGCYSGCSGTCYGTCRGGCEGYCKWGCLTSCSGSCNTTSTGY